jgi:hypothetical protein
MRGLQILILCFIMLTAACRMTSIIGNNNNSANNQLPNNLIEAPFSVREPEKYQAKIVFSFKFDTQAANFVQQKYFVARDGANRRLDFEIGDETVTRLQTTEGKTFVLLPKQKSYTELGKSASLPVNMPSEISLEHLLHAKPVGAKFQKIGAEDVSGKSAMKYKLDYGAVKEAENSRTETYIWVDETLGMPVKTEVSAIENGQPGGAKSVMELSEIKTETSPDLFQIPKDFRQLTLNEILEMMRN